MIEKNFKGKKNGFHVLEVELEKEQICCTIIVGNALYRLFIHDEVSNRQLKSLNLQFLEGNLWFSTYEAIMQLLIIIVDSIFESLSSLI